MSQTFLDTPVKAATLRKIMHLLDRLQSTEAGMLLYRQIGRMLSDYEEVCMEHEHTLIASISVLLDAISIHLEPSARLMDKISLLRARLAPPLDDKELNAVRRALERCADQVTLQEDVSESQVGTTINPLLNSFGLGGQSAPTYTDFSQTNSTDQRLLDHKKGMENVMESLSTHEKILKGLVKSREFGKLLESELGNIRHIDNIRVFDEKKTALLSGLELILQDHKQLTEYFDVVSDYIETVQNEGRRLNEELTRVTTLSLTDELTNLPNRRAFIKRLKDEISRAQRYGNSLALTLLDLDRFKPINDSYGHPAGDAVLVNYANNVLTTFRQNDLVARYGGEEFAVIFPNTSVEGAFQALQKVLRTANESVIQFENKTISLPSFSAGLVIYKVGESLESFVARADEALYRAKNTGGNRIESTMTDLTETD